MNTLWLRGNHILTPRLFLIKFQRKNEVSRSCQGLAPSTSSRVLEKGKSGWCQLSLLMDQVKLTDIPSVRPQTHSCNVSAPYFKSRPTLKKNNTQTGQPLGDLKELFLVPTYTDIGQSKWSITVHQTDFISAGLIRLKRTVQSESPGAHNNSLSTVKVIMMPCSFFSSIIHIFFIWAKQNSSSKLAGLNLELHIFLLGVFASLSGS